MHTLTTCSKLSRSLHALAPCPFFPLALRQSGWSSSMNIAGRKFRSCVNGVGDNALATDTDLPQSYQHNTSPARAAFISQAAERATAKGSLARSPT